MEAASNNINQNKLKEPHYKEYIKSKAEEFKLFNEVPKISFKIPNKIRQFLVY